VVQVFTFKGDKCVRVSEHYDRAEALRSIGANQASADAADETATSPRSP
jgi:hypothetical protein